MLNLCEILNLKKNIYKYFSLIIISNILNSLILYYKKLIGEFFLIAIE